MRAKVQLALALSLAATPACLASTVMSTAERLAAPAEAGPVWRAPVRADLLGYFESEAIEGEVAGDLWKVYYHFAEDGSFSGAALVRSPDGPPQFSTLSGRWQLQGEQLLLDDAEPARVRASEDRLELAASGGTLVLRRRAL